MLLSVLAQSVPGSRLTGDADIARTMHDSRQIQPGDLYIAIPGTKVDGHDFADKAVAAGAAALLVERELPLPVPQLVVPDAREGWTRVCSALYGHPQRQLKLIGITGTKGKSTTTWLIKAILEAAGHKCGLIGTIANFVGQERLEQHFTTPDPSELFPLFRRMADAGCEYCVMEISAQSIHQKKLAGLHFVLGGFTNFSQDHLDDFGDMEHYAAAKAAFFTPEYLDMAMVNRDDPTSARMLENWNGPTVTYSCDCDSDADSIAWLPVCTKDGCTFTWRLGERKPVRMWLKLIGKFNIMNALAAATACHMLGLERRPMSAALAAVPCIEGRVEKVPCNIPSPVYVDYAHSPDSLASALKAVRPFVQPGKWLVCVIGCGGNRDASKRPIMGRIAADLADMTILTSDNPRDEDPEAIMDQMEAGVRLNSLDLCIRTPDRREAIYCALDLGRNEGDVVIICGKGHETYQEIKGVRYPFDDKEIIHDYDHYYDDN